VSVELWDHNSSCEATVLSCSILRYEFELGVAKIGFLWHSVFISVVCVLSKYTVLTNCCSENHLNPVVLGFAYVLLL